MVSNRSPTDQSPAGAGFGRTPMLVAVVLLGTVASVLLARTLHVRERRVFEVEFEQRALERALLIERELRNSLERVESIAALYAVSGPLDRRDFSVFASEVLEGHASLQALGFNPVVRAPMREAHERAVRLEGYPDYSITERTPDGRLVSASYRDEYVVVALLEPLDGNRAALGFDIASESVRRQALLRARDSGRPAVTGRVKLVQETGDQYGVLICVPLYSGPHPQTVDERRERLQGYAVGVLRMGDVVNEALSALRPTGIHIRLLDDDAPEERKLLHFHVSRTLPAESTAVGASERTADDEQSFNLEFAGRRWSVHAEATDAFRAAHASWAPLGTLFAGLLTTVLIAGYLARQAAVNLQLRSAIVQRERADEHRASFGRVIDESHDEIYIFDADSLRFVHVNRGAQLNLGYSMDELRRLTPVDLKPELTHESFAELLRPLREGTLQRTNFTTIHRRKDGSTYDVEVHLQLTTFDSAAAFVAVVLDITERKQLEERYTQAQRLEALGTLAGGLAHDFNNLLTAIVGYTEMSLVEVPPDSELHGFLTEVIKASERARDVVRRILTFSRRNPMTYRPFDLAELTRDALKLARASLPSTITIDAELVGNFPCEGDSTQIHQVLMNLCTNAGHAMRENGGLLDVRLESVELSTAEATALGDLKLGEYARLSVRDTGHGIPSEICDRIFDPFFTTKGPGEGTGLGLSVAHSIVASHGGCMNFTSSQGQGTTFEIYLPRAESHGVIPAEPGELSGEGTESILVVDDEPAVASLLTGALQRSGYRVESFTDSMDALKSLQSPRRAIDLVITDYTMPRMKGTEFARQLRQITSDVPVILVSGYGDLLDDDEVRDSGVRAVLTKPLRLSGLKSTVRRVLDETLARGHAER